MYKTRMTINDVRNANSKLPKTINGDLVFPGLSKIIALGYKDIQL